MRFFMTFFLLLCLMAAPAQAQEMQAATDALFFAMETAGLSGVPQDVQYDQVGPWIAVSGAFEKRAFTAYLGIIFDTRTEDLVAWEDVFTDGDAAALRMEDIAEASRYDNAYAEYDQVRPMPRDNFTLIGDQLTVYYPPEQLSYFAGEAGAFAFYAYELDGLLQDGVPLTIGDEGAAKDALWLALETGTLPMLDTSAALGMPMYEADERFGLVDVPDVKTEAAVWHFEAPQMRAVSFLTKMDDRNVNTATVQGIHAERIDFSGLCTGISTRAECAQALGAADEARLVEEADAYSLLPVGESLLWRADGKALVLHFVDDVLHSVTLQYEG